MNITTNGLYTYKFDLRDLCRICGTNSNDLNSMFDDNGSAYDFASKINEYLPITVRKSDYLPQKICSMCASTLLSFHQLYIICQSNNSRFLQSLEGEAYEHHVVKSHVVGDTSELLELQSSFSREIENEILNMHESKEINEAESEIAANAAVNELERIGSAENISFVEETDAMNSIEENKEIEDLSNIKSDRNNQKSESDRLRKTDNLKGDGESKSKIDNKSKKEPIRKHKNEEKTKTFAKTRSIKSPKKTVKNPKAEILTENITRLKSNKNEKSAQIQTDDKNVKENSFIESESQKSIKIPCEYCTQEFTTKSLLIDHIKDTHNDLIFHCEMCDDYVARVELISHMLNHALNPNSNVVKKVGEKENETQNNSGESSPKSTTKTKTTENDIASDKNQNGKSENHKQSKTKNRAQNYCLECDKTFADSGGYKYHINSFHKKIKKYECDICGNHFSCKRVITNHLRGVHMKERIFECNQCAKRFSTDSALYMHKKIHDNVFKSVCEICERKFRSQSKLKIHMTMHTKEKNHFCEVCHRGFAVRNNLTKHMLTHSKSFDFKCSYVANQKRYLAEHIKRSHRT